MKLTPWNKMIQNLVLSSTKEGIILAQILMNDYEVISHWVYAPHNGPITYDGKNIEWERLNLPELYLGIDSSWEYIACSIQVDFNYMKNLYNEYLEQNSTETSGK